MTQTPKRWRYLPLLAVATYGVLLATFAQVGFPKPDGAFHFWPYLSVQPVGEDAFYYLSTAWNLAEGDGLTADGATLVTGIQPLVPILLSVPATIIQWLGGDKWHLIRFVILLQTAIHCTLAVLLARLAGRISGRVGHRESLLTFALAITSFPLFRLVTYGLETGVYLCLIVASIWISYDLVDTETDDLDERIQPAFSPWAIGFIFGLTGLARIDFGLAIAIFFVVGLGTGLLSLERVLKSGATATAVVTPWLAYVYSQMKTIVPSSGVSESALLHTGDVILRLVSTLRALLEIALPPWFVRFGYAVSDIGGILAALLVAGVAWMYRDNWRGLLNRPATAWLASLLGLAIVYFLTFRSSWFYHRYFSPLYIFALPVLAVAIGELMQRDSTRSWSRLLIVILTAQFFVWAYTSLHHNAATRLQRLPAHANHAIGAGLVDRHLRGDATPDNPPKIASFQSGTLGYFHDRIVNLDGKVNNDVLPHLADDTLCAYLHQTDVHYIVDWQPLIHDNLPTTCLDQHFTSCSDTPDFPHPFVCLERSERGKTP